MTPPTSGSRSVYWRDEPGPPPAGARVLHPIASVLMRMAWNVRVYRRDLVPRRGPVVLAANHTGILDGPLLYAVLHRPVHALVKQEMFAGPIGAALRALGQIAVDRFAPDPAAVKSCLAVLERGDVLGIYPEGTRGTGDFARIKPGVAYLALCTGAPSFRSPASARGPTAHPSAIYRRFARGSTWSSVGRSRSSRSPGPGDGTSSASLPPSCATSSPSMFAWRAG